MRININPDCPIIGKSVPRMAIIVSMMSGLESFVKREVEMLADRGYSLRLFATKYTTSPGFDPRSDIPFHTPSAMSVAKGLLHWSLRKPLLVFQLLIQSVRLNGIIELLLALSWAKILLDYRLQLIHCAFGDRKYFVGYFLQRLTGLPLTVAIHAHEIYAQPNEPLFRHALKYTSGIVTISAKNQHLLGKKYALNNDDIDLIRLTIDLDFWKPRTSEINVLTVARFTPRKGWHELIDAAKQLGPSFHFYGVGFGELDIEALAQSAGVGDQFTIFPKLRPAHLRLLMQACDIFCLPSKPTAEEGSEGIPVVLMEAMAMSMPIVTTDDGSISELVETEIVPSADAGALAEGLRRTAARLDPWVKATDSANRERVSHMHSVTNVEQLDAFFRRRARCQHE